MTDLQLDWAEAELLATGAIEAPLIAGGVRCHGGFDATGTYISPRNENRATAIANWQANHTQTFGTSILDVPLETWPENYPNVAQAKYLLDEGVREPIIALLTRVGTVEGFGGVIRHSAIPNIQRHFDEDIRGTALAHLDGGLFEAHARDEAGHEDEGGHNLMWFAARDVAFENPLTADQTQIMIERLTANGGGPMERPRWFPDIDGDLEAAFQFMARLLLIEISAFHVFAWAEEVLSDETRVAGDGEAGRLVSYIRQDETPHVEYLKTALTEMRDRTFIGASGKKHKGTEVINRVWNTALDESLGIRREQNIKLTVKEVEHALAAKPGAKDILERFHELGTVRV
jgi:hypothetical protein